MSEHARMVDHRKLAQLRKKADNADARKNAHKDWPTTADCVRLIRYIKYDCGGLVTLIINKQEVFFNVTHDPKDPEHIFIKRADNVAAPCGWFTLSKLESFLYESGVVMND